MESKTSSLSRNRGSGEAPTVGLSADLPEPEGCSVDRPLRLRPITDDDLTRASNESYQHGRRHGKIELADEIETLIYWLLRCYQSGHREGWEPGATTQETMDGLLHVLANRGYDPNEDDAAKELIARIENTAHPREKVDIR